MGVGGEWVVSAFIWLLMSGDRGAGYKSSMVPSTGAGGQRCSFMLHRTFTVGVLREALLGGIMVENLSEIRSGRGVKYAAVSYRAW